MVKNNTIENVTNIRFGFYAQPEKQGTVAYLQVRQFNDEGRLISDADEYINIDKKTEVHLLKDGDVLFVGKGNRLFSWCYRQISQRAVASSIFFVLRPNLNVIFPEYLTAILNAPQYKAAFQQLGSGTNILSIRKSELGAFQIPIPDMETQKRIAEIASLHENEINLHKQLMLKKQDLYQSIISTITNS